MCILRGRHDPLPSAANLNFVFTQHAGYTYSLPMETNQLLNLTTVQLRRAAEVKERIDQLTEELGQILSGSGKVGSAAPQTRSAGKRQMSAAGRSRIAEAARARWARVRAAKGESANSNGKSDTGK